jgi:hypothetical protein
LDIGFKFGYLKPDTTKSLVDKFASGVDFGIDYLLLGADFRYALFDKKVFPFKLSIGLGINYLKGGITSAFSSGIEFNDPVFDISISQKSPGKLDVYWNTINFELKPQVSFPLKIITPYAGAGLSFSLTEAGYKVITPPLELNGPFTKDQIMQILKDEFGIDVLEEGFRYVNNKSKFNMRAFGGFSVNLIFVRLDFTGMYNLLSGDLGATFGFRFQL